MASRLAADPAVLVLFAWLGVPLRALESARQEALFPDLDPVTEQTIEPLRG